MQHVVCSAAGHPWPAVRLESILKPDQSIHPCQTNLQINKMVLLLKLVVLTISTWMGSVLAMTSWDVGRFCFIDTAEANLSDCCGMKLAMVWDAPRKNGKTK